MSSGSEPALPQLLLNYFVCMAYEDASIRLAKELGYVVTNKDSQEFTDLYKIKERAQIRNLINRGEINSAMEQINKVFGIHVLEKNNDSLHFKLLLLNFIEMIRNKTSNDESFIQELIKYSQEKLALKASTNKSYMKELELVMTLLLFPSTTSSDDLPPVLQKLYSLSLRSKLADLVNRNLLKHIHPDIISRHGNGTGYPDVIGLDTWLSYSNTSNSGIHQDIWTIRPKEDIETHLTKDSLGDFHGDISTPLLKDKDHAATTAHWNETSRKLVAPSDTQKEVGEEKEEDEDISQLKYEARLIQIMKLWAWSSNELHKNGIDIPNT